ncbi:vWA domain-containing protein [Luteipulveratus flavus]|uniref:VWA domain-containing protein n=1 Tax=Luteipulveratus flavus TaxID=3031728 RepID=A0ABT6C277_9MICO|nr:VWA domain-containing protein [Luteipulveratus sp. YIM 133296]MDF8263013.1 VWA domain-containing protein [Luteipulveratus sp. YIM 133296]
MPSPAEPAAPPHGSVLARRLVQVATSLRGHGVKVGTSEIADAGAVVQALGLDDRETLREGLASAFLRRAGQRGVFDDVFDIYFPAGVGSRSGTQADPPTPDAAPREVAASVRGLLMEALARDDRAELDRLAALALDRLGELEREGAGWSAAQALEQLAPQTAIAGALQRARQLGAGGDGSQDEGEQGGGSGTQGSGSGGGSGAGSAGREQLTDRIAREEMRSRVAAFRRRVETEARRRNAEVRGTERISRYAVRDAFEQRDFLAPGGGELAQLRAAINPLARKLAARLTARRRQQARGTIDVRKTLRRSMSTGGVPLDPAYAHRRPHRPDLVLLCDVSGSVAGFSGFTMALMQAISAQFNKIRVFAFVSTTDEITDLVRAARPEDDVVSAALRTRKVLGWGASSSYGQSLDSFAEKFMDAVGPRSTVLILGDARSNYGLPRLETLRTIRGQARHVAWLNPEPASSWGTGDSLAKEYARVVDMHECRNIDQLRAFVGRALPV